MNREDLLAEWHNLHERLHQIVDRWNCQSPDDTGDCEFLHSLDEFLPKYREVTAAILGNST